MPEASRGDCWIFGYGSLVWRPGFPHVERRAGCIEGWSRRFWQGSTDHRGLPRAPGRVVTLIREPNALCWGAAYRVASQDCDAVLRTLDRREKGGFERRRVEVQLREPHPERVSAAMYVAGSDNPNYLGPAPPAEIAAQVRRSTGPSGSNAEYVLRLAQALRELCAHDAHVFDLAMRVGDGT